jgi:UDPglucose 6-dehydrogenase
MPLLNLNWRNAQLPPKTAIFAIGDIHGHDQLLRPMLAAIEKKIAALSNGVKAHVIFIGDYIDRGTSGPKTIKLLIEFEQRMVKKSYVKTTYLCGNHDEFFKRLLETRRVIDEPIGNPADKNDITHCVSYADGSMNLRGLEDWLFSGGGITTVQNYLPDLDRNIFDFDNKRFNRSYPDYSLKMVNDLLKELAEKVPPAHKDFFTSVYENRYLILGDYLFTHAGTHPEKTLADQGIGPDAQPLAGKAYLDFLMLRNEFLWRDDNDLPNCPYIVVHGHTPSEIQKNLETNTNTASGPTIADGQKDYRLCLDTNIYKQDGALTCFMRTNDYAGFMAVNKESPDKLSEYSIPKVGNMLLTDITNINTPIIMHRQENNMTKNPTIGFAGMTHLGLNSAVAAAEKGFSVVGFDPNKNIITELQASRTHINEPALVEMLRANKERLSFTTSSDDLKACDIVYISLDVPTDDQAQSDLTPVRAMIDEVNAVISKDALLAVLCQVPPGFTRSIKRNPACLYYQVETLIFGRAMERALFPERYIIGCADPAAPMNPALASHLQAYGCPILPMRYESAELAKTAINIFLAAQVCTANTLAELCEKIDADWQEIIPSLRLDKRIGQHAYISSGLGLSGGNIERDLKTVSQIGHEMGAKVTIPQAYIDHSHYRKQWSVRKFFEHYDATNNACTVAILGLAYKENTHSVKNSPAVELLEALPDIAIRLYDPVVKELKTCRKVAFCNNAQDAIKNVDIICIMTPWDEFKKLDWQSLLGSMRGKIIIDPYQLVKLEDNTFLHCVLGRKDHG